MLGRILNFKGRESDGDDKRSGMRLSKNWFPHQKLI